MEGSSSNGSYTNTMDSYGFDSVAEDRNQRRAVLNAVMKLLVL
jgi:hypothetical protein